MTVRNTTFVSLLGAVAALWVVPATAQAQTKISPEASEAVSEGEPKRYSLVEADGDILRVDRQNGTVAVCRERNGAWRCNPVPLAEEAYLAEINELAAEVDRLTVRLEQLESADSDHGAPKAPGTADKRSGPDNESGDRTSRWTEEEEELERVLTFTESAMRRFFGMVRDLQKDFEGERN